jgi:hypothetical protein
MELVENTYQVGTIFFLYHLDGKTRKKEEN